MTMASAALHGRSLLAIFAHPDDESLACGGLLAWCAEGGARVSVLCLTDGGHGPDARTADDAASGLAGQGGAAVATREGLGPIRARELDAACRILGVSRVERLEYEDGMLPWSDPDRIETDIRHAIARAQPDVVVTFDEDGLYWHPDHIAAHERTTAVVAAAGAGGPALYYVTIPPGRMRAVVQAAEATLIARGLEPPDPVRILGIADPDAFGAAAPPPTVVADLAGFARRKLAAIRCHRSQLHDDALDLVEPEDAARLLGVEQYRRAPVGSRGETFIDRLPQSN